MSRDESLEIPSKGNASYASPKPGFSQRSLQSWPWFEGVFLVLVPLAVLTLGPFQLFPPLGWVDAGMYLSYFLDFPRKLAEFGPNYHAMRLPFTLTGFFVHRIFSPKFANYVLVLGFHYLALFSVYYAVRARQSRAVAVSAALFLALNPLWIATVTRGYVDGPGMAFLFASLACLANRGGAISVRAGTVLAGVLAALSAFCNAIAGIVTILAILSWLYAEGISWRELRRTALHGIAGVAVATGVLSLISWLMKGPFFFFYVNVYFGSQALSGFGVNYLVPRGEWMPSAYRLALPIAFLCAGLSVLLAKWRGASSTPLLTAGCATIVLTVIWFLLWDFGIGSSTLQFAHYGGYFIPGQCLVFAGLAAVLLSKDDAQAKLNWAEAGALVATAIVTILLVQQIWALEAKLRSAYLLWLVIVLLFVAAIALMRRRAPGVGLAILMFTTVLAGTANADTRGIFRVGPNPDYKPFYELMVRLNWIVDSTRAGNRPFYLWYCRECLPEAQRDSWRVVELRYMGTLLRTNMLDSIVSLWQWDRSWLNYTMPSLSAEEVRRLKAAPEGSTLVLLCPEEVACNDATAALQRAGLATHERARVPLSAPRVLDLNVLILDVGGDRPSS
jgi:4-amino-4-deoxy-L-arabinose transferase-like glycosyltransferase